MAGNQGNNKIIFEQWQLDFLKANWQTMNATQLSNHLRLGKKIVRNKKYELGLYKMKLEYWTDEQIDYLKNNYRQFGDVELAEQFNERWQKNKKWTKQHINKKRGYLGFKRTPEEIAAIKKLNVKNGRYKVCLEHSWDTRGRSKNGDIRTWLVGGYVVLVIKNNGKWEHYRRFLYRKEIGEIPKGMNVRLKDGDPYNVVKNNLELVSNAQQGLLNSTQRNNLELKRQKVKSLLKLNIQRNEKQIKRLE